MKYATPLDDAVPLAHSVEVAAKRVGIGRTKLFELIRTGRLRAVHYGRRTLVPEESLKAFLASLPPTTAK
jgi:excisionase family DNA binding protein